MSCLLCDELGGKLLWQDDFCRVVRADEPDSPGFLRVILNAHVREMTDLPAADQQALMHMVFAAETAHAAPPYLDARLAAALQQPGADRDSKT